MNLFRSVSASAPSEGLWLARIQVLTNWVSLDISISCYKMLLPLRRGSQLSLLFFANTWFLPLFNGGALLKWVAIQGRELQDHRAEPVSYFRMAAPLHCWPEDISMLGPCPSLPCGTSHPVGEIWISPILCLNLALIKQTHPLALSRAQRVVYCSCVGWCTCHTSLPLSPKFSPNVAPAFFTVYPSGPDLQWSHPP